MRNALLSSAFLLCVGFVACNDIPELPEVPVSLFTVCASMPEATRTSLGETTANGYKTTWMAGDAIGLFSDTDPSVNRMLVTYQSAPSVTFSGVGAVAGNEYFAYYPYSPDATFSDGVFSLEMPSEQRCTDDAICWSMCRWSHGAVRRINCILLIAAVWCGCSCWGMPRLRK